jgi:hypothetical protein
MSTPLMVTVDWPSDQWHGEQVTGLSGLYSCGCWSSPVHEASSQWDCPDDIFDCPTHGEVQFDLRLQALLYAQWEDDAVAIPWEDRSTK